MRRLWCLTLLGLLLAGAVRAPVIFAETGRPAPNYGVHDLSMLVTPELPCVWPVGMTPLAVVPTRTFGPGPFHRDLVMIDEHTGTQWDAPAHFVPPPDSQLPGAGPNGLLTNEKVPAWQFCGEACVIDITARCDDAARGESYLIDPGVVRDWEVKHRPLKFGDVVLFHSGYNDKYYQPFPAGDRLVASPLAKTTPGWPGPRPETMDFLANRGVMTVGLDSPSLGPLPDLAAAAHQAGGKRGMVWTECMMNLKNLRGFRREPSPRRNEPKPPSELLSTGAFYAMLGPKHAGGSGGECRALAISGALAPRLIASARQKRVVDLSVTLHDDYPVTWPGRQPGDEANRYVGQTLNSFAKARGPYFARSHMFDSQAGTHVVLPSYSIPPRGFDRSRYAKDVLALLEVFEKQHGPIGTSDATIDSTPLETMMGEARVIDLRKLVSTTGSKQWPASPKITLSAVTKYELETRPIAAGDVVIFYSGHSDRHFRPLPALPEIDGLMAAPLAGKSEGWPTPDLDVIKYLADRGVKCLGTDGPTLGGVDRGHEMQVYWLTGKHGMNVVEFLTNVGEIHDKKAFFIFAPVKIKGLRAGYGRAVALY